jgi:glucuronosyltransferase
MDESIIRTVPMLVIPFLADQDANARRVSSKNIGASLELFSLSEAKLKKTILEVLKPEYKRNIEKLRDLILDEPMSTRERAVWWVEYVIRHNGTKHLDYVGRQIPLYQKYFLDFIGIGLLSLAYLILTLYLIKYLISLAYHAIFGGKDKVE